MGVKFERAEGFEGIGRRASPRLRVVVRALPLLLWGVACDGPSSEVAPFSVTDSAGVLIAENAHPLWDGEARWIVEEQPSIVIGSADGPSELLFSRIAGAWMTAAGSIIVAERSDPDGAIRFYGQDGRFIRQVGQAGSGPGEFELLFHAFPYRADSIAAWDPLRSRLTVFDEEGALGRTQSIQFPTEQSTATDGPTQIEMGAVVDAFSDGTFLTSPNYVMVPAGAPRPLELVHYRYSAEGDSLNRIEPTREGTRASANMPFAPRSVRAVDGDHFYQGAGDTYEIRVQSLTGRLVRVIRASHRDLSLTEQDRQSYRDSRRESASGERELAEVDLELRTLDFPESLPPYRDLKVDAEGYLWVSHHPPLGEDLPTSWDVFDPDGRLLGTVTTPSRVRLHQISRDFLVGEYVGALGVPQVHVYSLSRQ